ncbi:tripartite tricarboxylate transporter substrate binding protein [Pantoea sp. 18069]|uniref:Bug family tripartite tricarboxylate transporter substrate binding protein n=1 Tax=Pantoea sp. 18069 TaxID=2681415 RepID=UPI00135956F2|nr:tripartite tricarboxylate transporter substrate binding protein [Pantoea sp. 18069]
MKLARVFGGIATGILITSAAWAQAFPHKPVTVVVPFVPGGSSDATMRALSIKLGENLGQPVILENKPGVNGTLGVGLALRAPADGYTLTIGSVGTYAISPQLIKAVKWDPLKDVDMLGIPVRTVNVIVVTPSFPANTLPELLDYMKKNPGKVSFANSGEGSTDHLTSMLLWQKTGVAGLNVAYKGGGAALTDVMAGHANVLITNLSVLLAQIKAGRLKAIAVTAENRIAELPNVPTVAESGVKGLDVYSWQGIAAPKGLSQPVRDKITSALVATLKDPSVVKSLEQGGFEVVSLNSTQAQALLQSEIQRWKTVIDVAGVRAE